MADEKKFIFTSEGFKKLEEELENLKVVRRAEVAVKIKEARSQGDLSENAEYDAAKEEQAEIEARIITIEKMLRNADVIESSETKDNVSLGDTVRFYDEKKGTEFVYSIVGSAEADPLSGKISNESPIGVALIGKRVGDKVVVNAPSGSFRYTILEIR